LVIRKPEEEDAPSFELESAERVEAIGHGTPVAA